MIRRVFRKIISAALLLCGLVFVLAARAQTTISTNIPGVSANNPCDYVFSFYKFAMMISGVLALGAIVYGGVTYTLAAGNPSGQSEGKEWVKGALTGMLLLVSTYLILNVINPNLIKCTLPTLTKLTAVQTNSQTTTGYLDKVAACIESGTNIFICNQSQTPQSCAPIQGLIDTGQCDASGGCVLVARNCCGAGVGTAGCPARGTSACTPLTSGDASQNKLNSTCFNSISGGSYNGSSIASKESGGDPAAESTSDKCSEDGNVFSWGLFQINLTVNDVNGLGCPSAFNHKAQLDRANHVYHCRVVDKPRYDKCVTAATKSSPNISAACPLAASSLAWDNWSVNCTCNFTPPSPHKLSCSQ